MSNRDIIFKLNNIQNAIDFINYRLNLLQPNNFNQNSLFPQYRNQDQNNLNHQQSTRNIFSNLRDPFNIPSSGLFSNPFNRNSTNNIFNNLNNTNNTNNNNNNNRENDNSPQIEISFTNPLHNLSTSTNLLNSLFNTNTDRERERIIIPSHRIISNNTELKVYKNETDSNQDTNNNEDENNDNLENNNNDNQNENRESNNEICTICQETIIENSIIRKIKKCNHFFHSECLDKWLENHITCPTCRQDIRVNITL